MVATIAGKMATGEAECVPNAVATFLTESTGRVEAAARAAIERKLGGNCRTGLSYEGGAVEAPILWMVA